MSVTPATHRQLAELAAFYRDDPYGFVMASYPWMEPTLPDGSYNPLHNKKGPEDWQRDYLIAWGNHIWMNDQRIAAGLQPKVWRSARASGHGVGKSTLVAWILQFCMATRANTRGVVTANTQRQLEDKTWPELAKWHKLFLFKDWFEWTSTSYYFKLAPDEERKNYMLTAMTVSEDNTEAFAGLHNEQGTVIIVFDEASGIHHKIWEVAQGATTDGEVFFAVFGNPTQATGDFADCFDKYAELYNTGTVDSRAVSHTNKEAIADIITMYGIDSDEVKVRVLGQFPTQSFNGFIAKATVDVAQQRQYVYDPGEAIIMSIDVARFGRDKTIFFWRQGRNARLRKPMLFSGLSTVRIAELAAREASITKPDAIVIESTGPGAGVIDMLRATYRLRVVEVHPGAPSTNPQHYYRKRDELWGLGRDWLLNEGCLDPDDTELAEQLTSILYTLDRFEQRIKMETKQDMFLRLGGGSPDRADAFILTFGIKLPRRDMNLNLAANVARNMSLTEYDEINYGAT